MKFMDMRLMGLVSSLVLLMAFMPSVMAQTVTDPTQNTTVGTARGPEGRTNIQTSADFENHPLYTTTSTDEQGYGFGLTGLPENAIAADFHTMSLAQCGPEGSTTCLEIDQYGGPYHGPRAGGTERFFYLNWYSKYRKGENGYISQARRANNHSFWIRGYDEINTDPSHFNLDVSGHAKRRTPSTLVSNAKETDNMHNYYQGVLDWGGSQAAGGGAWREIVFGEYFQHQRSEIHKAGYHAFLDRGYLWPDHTRLAYSVHASEPDAPLGKVYLDNFTWFYQNPFLSGFPQQSTQRTLLGEASEHELIIWNTHPTKTRSFILAPSGHFRTSTYASDTINWYHAEMDVVDASGVSIRETGPLAPGEGYVFYVRQQLPPVNVHGNPISEDVMAMALVSAFEDPTQVADPMPYLRVNAGKVMEGNDRFDVPGVGFVLKTYFSNATSTDAGPAPALSGFQVNARGGSWADLSWLSPAVSQDDNERSTGPAAMAYAVRYSLQPIVNEADWEAATPVEGAPPVFGPGIPQHYALAGLNTNTTYHVAARVYNEAHQGGPIATLSFTTLAQDVDLRGGAPEKISVNAGADRVIRIGESVALYGVTAQASVTNPGHLATAWSIEGPESVAVLDAQALATTAQFTTAGTYTVSLTAQGGGQTATDAFRLIVLDTEEVLLVDYGFMEGTDTFGLPGWDQVLVDGYTERTAQGAHGMTYPDNRTYNYQGVQGTPHTFTIGQRIEVRWFNQSASPITFAPHVSFDDPDRRVSGEQGTWYELDAITLLPYSGGSSFFRIGGEAAGTHTLVNINSNAPEGNFVVADAIILRKPGANGKPYVVAGDDQTLQFPATVSLTGEVQDDGLPGADLTISWTKVSGPGEVTFADASQPTTTATFSEAGSYVLQLVVFDGELQGADDVTIAVLTEVPNDPPAEEEGGDETLTFDPSAPGLIVDFGADVSSTQYGLEGWATLLLDRYTALFDANVDGAVSSVEGNPSYNFQGMQGIDRAFTAGEQVVVHWYNAGPDPVGFTPYISFDDPDRRGLDTPGTWHFMTPVTLEPGATGTSALVVDAQIAGVYALVNVNNNLANKEVLVADRIVIQEPVPVGPEVLVDFGADEAATIFGVAGWNTLLLDRYTKLFDADIDGAASWVAGNPGYNFQGVQGAEARYFGLGEQVAVQWYNASDDTMHFTPYISFDDPDRRVMQAQGTWYPMSSVVLPPGERAASAYVIDGPSAGSYTLVNVNNNVTNANTVIADVITVTSPEENGAPYVTASTAAYLSIRDAATLVGTALDDGLPYGTLTIEWSVVSGPGAVQFADAATLATTASFSKPGTYLLQLSATDEAVESSTTIQVDVLGSGDVLFVNFGADEASTQFGQPGWTTLLLDRYTALQGGEVTGAASWVAGNPTYNFQGVQGESYDFASDDRIEVRWFNAGEEPLTFTPYISFDDPDRRGLGTSGTWYSMSSVVVEAGQTATSTYVVDASSAGTYTMLNINNNLTDEKRLVADHIVLRGPETLGSDGVLVDFGADEASTTFGLFTWQSLLLDRYTGLIGATTAGAASFVSGNPTYNYQGVQGTTDLTLTAGTRVVVQWYNAGTETLNFTPYVSFDDPDRRDIGTPGTWYAMSAVSLAPDTIESSEYTVGEGAAGAYRLVNINNNLTNQNVLIADQVAIIAEEGAMRVDANTLKAPAAELFAQKDATVELPTTFNVSQNYPNPFSEHTIISLALPEDAYVSVSVFNILGQKVRTLSDANMTHGYHHVRWDGTDDGGRRLGSGLYFYHVQTDEHVTTRQMVLVR